jgi:lipoprotein-anchoring transpeptidase ErfK/SrfK
MTTARTALVSLLIALFAAPAAALAQSPQPTPTPTPTPPPQQQPPPPQEQRIPPGVFAGGVDLSNLTIPEAEAKLHELDAPLAKPVVVAVAGKRFKISAKSVKFAFDANRTARRAYQQGTATPPDQSQAGGTAARLDVPLAVTFRRGTIKGIVGKIAKRVHLGPRNATLTITLRKMVRRKSKTGRALDQKATRAAIEAAFGTPDPNARLLKPGRVEVKPKINALDLAKVYPTVITIDKSNFRLRLFKRLRFVKSYGVATGLPAYPTPSGLFRITNKAVNPTWTAPNSPWAGELAGTQTPGGSPANPLKARWLGIVNGVGIHGTGQEYSIGSRASHGCLRMRVADVIDLYPRVPVGTPVLIR